MNILFGFSSWELCWINYFGEGCRTLSLSCFVLINWYLALSIIPWLYVVCRISDLKAVKGPNSLRNANKRFHFFLSFITTQLLLFFRHSTFSEEIRKTAWSSFLHSALLRVKLLFCNEFLFLSEIFPLYLFALALSDILQRPSRWISQCPFISAFSQQIMFWSSL